MKTTVSRKQILIIGGLSALILAAYSVSLLFPFVQDDWGSINRFQNGHPGEIIKSVFAGEGNRFFRPLSGLYLYSMYLVFGANPLPFHVVALAMLVANSLLVIAIMRFITRDETVSIASGFVYALGGAVHMESILWAVGIHDLGGSFFFLLAMFLFFRERPIWSAGAFLAGCLFKETVIVLPVILTAYVFILEPRHEGLSAMRSLRRLWPMAAALIAVIAIELAWTSPFGLPSSHPYAVDFFGRHILPNLYSYAAWMTQCFNPLLFVSGATIRFVLNDLLLVFLFCVWLASRRQREETGALDQPRSSEAGALWFLLVWMCMALTPCIFLPNHTYRYYAMYALPAFIGAVLLQVRILFDSAWRGRIAARGLVILVAAGAVILSILHANIMFREGLRQRTLSDGTNYLIRRAATVEIVRGGLMKQLPSPPHGAVILLDDVDLGAFGKDLGPRAWYGDQSICVYKLDSYRNDATGSNALVPPDGLYPTESGSRVEKIQVDPAKVFAFRLVGLELKPVQP